MMNRIAIIVFAITLLHSAAWSQNANVAGELGYPDMILYNGKVVTMDDSSFGPEVGTSRQAMAVRNGRILMTGTSAQIQALAGSKTVKIDLKGREVLPSFTHTH